MSPESPSSRNGRRARSTLAMWSMMNSVPTCSAWACICSISQGPWIDLGEARIVLDVGGDGHLPAGLVALDHDRLEHCARCIDGGGVARGPRPQDDDFGMLGRHGWQNPGGPSVGTNPELIWERYRPAAMPRSMHHRATVPGTAVIGLGAMNLKTAAEGLPVARPVLAYRPHAMKYALTVLAVLVCLGAAGMLAALGQAASRQRPGSRPSHPR